MTAKPTFRGNRRAIDGGFMSNPIPSHEVAAGEIEKCLGRDLEAADIETIAEWIGEARAELAKWRAMFYSTNEIKETLRRLSTAPSSKAPALLAQADSRTEVLVIAALRKMGASVYVAMNPPFWKIGPAAAFALQHFKVPRKRPPDLAPRIRHLWRTLGGTGSVSIKENPSTSVNSDDLYVSPLLRFASVMYAAVDPKDKNLTMWAVADRMRRPRRARKTVAG